MNRKRRTEEFLNSLAHLVGYTALVALVASIFYVVIHQMVKQSKSDEAYMEAVRESADAESSVNWSGVKESQPALMALKSRPASPADPARASEVVKRLENETQLREDSTISSQGPRIAGVTNVEAKRPLIEQAVRKFFEAGSVSEKLAYVRDPGRVRPLMNDYYNRQPMPKTKWAGLGWTLPVDEPGYRLGYVQATFEGTPPASLVVEELENGSFVVDWESFVRYGELDWRDFLKLKPSQPKLFRVIASKADRPSSIIIDRAHETIEIKHPAEDGTVFATFDTSDPALAPLVEQLQSGKWKDVPVTLRLCYPGATGDSGAVRVAGVEGKGWLILQHTRS